MNPMNELPTGFADLSTPQEIEIGFIASFLDRPERIKRYAHIHPDMLSPVFGRVWQILQALSDEGSTPSAEVVGSNITSNGDLANALSLDKVSYRQWLFDAQVMSLPDDRLRSFSEVIIDRWKRRQAVDLAKDLNASMVDVEDLQGADHHLARFSKALKDISSSAGYGVVMSVDDIAAIASRSESPFERFSTGYERLDKAMGGGLVAPGVTVIEARPKCFKTGTMGSIAYNLAKQGVRSAFLSMEMPCEQIIMRLMAAEGTGNVRNYDSYPDRRRREAAFFADRYRGLFDLFDLPNATFSKIQSSLWTAVDRGNRVLFLDYFQLIRGCPQFSDMLTFREDVAGWLQGFVNETKTALVCAAQVGRSGETYGSDALNRNASFVGQIRKADAHSQRIERQRFWFEGRFSRHAELFDIGSDNDGPLSISDVGPVLRIDDDV